MKKNNQAVIESVMILIFGILLLLILGAVADNL
jgi:hypothetical protein